VDDITSPRDENPRDTISRLQHLLAEAIEARAWALDMLAAYETERPPDRHWFIDDGDGYCRACNTLRHNRRHVQRAAAVAG
jgi:hypothetical protein